jgi:hypothetical protein
MADFLANPVDIRFCSMPAKSTTQATCLIIEGNAVTTDQQIKTDLSSESHPPAPSDLITGINHVEGTLSDMIKVWERVKHPRRTSSSSSMSLGLRNAAHVASRYMKRKIQIESGTCVQDHRSCRSTSVPCPQEASSTSYCSPPPPAEPRDISGSPRVSDCPHNHLPELSGRGVRDSRS